VNRVTASLQLLWEPFVQTGERQMTIIFERLRNLNSGKVATVADEVVGRPLQQSEHTGLTTQLADVADASLNNGSQNAATGRRTKSGS
jgi:hypothetical protein